MTATQDAISERLLRSSARHSYDPEVDIDWDAPVDPTLWGMQPERMSLYGTYLWDGLTEEQRITLSWHEVASIASVGLWFELLLMQMMLRDLYDDDPTGAHMQYALTEVADECRHSTMFGKSIAHFGVPAYGPPQRIHTLGRLFNHVVRGPSAYASILVAEELLDTWQRDLMKDERVQPLTRATSQIHVVEEARHMRFAREEIARRTPELSGWQRRKHRTIVASVAAIVADNLVQPGVYAAVGLDPDEARTAARANEHYAGKLRDAAAGLTRFLREVGLIGGPSELLWKRARLV